MNPQSIICELANNAKVFEGLFTGLNERTYKWKPVPEKWCLLEILCHLYDEEREDFRARVKHVLETPDKLAPGINPTEWVTSRNYIEADYFKRLDAFLEEREKSIEWLNSLENPNWEIVYKHPELGNLSAGMFLCNWLAHDYLHIRQINWMKYHYLKDTLTSEPLGYAGAW